MGETGFASLPLAVYGVILLAAALAHWVLVRTCCGSSPRSSGWRKASPDRARRRLLPGCATPRVPDRHYPRARGP